MTTLLKNLVKPRVIRLSYSNSPCDPENSPTLHQLRDCAAFDDLMAGLVEAGLRYETVFHLFPGCKRNFSDYPKLLAGDTLVLASRPPMGSQNPKKPIKPSNCAIENALFTELKSFFERISRGEVRLHADIVNGLPSALKCIQRCGFVMLGEGTLREVHMEGYSHDSRGLNTDRIALGYFLHTPLRELPGCRAIISFSMGGYENIIWNQWVRRHRSHWLEKPIFAIAEFLVPRPDNPPVASPLLLDADLGFDLKKSQILKALCGPLDREAHGYFVLHQKELPYKI
jgi:hypothetical protein